MYVDPMGFICNSCLELHPGRLHIMYNHIFKIYYIILYHIIFYYIILYYIILYMCNIYVYIYYIYIYFKRKGSFSNHYFAGDMLVYHRVLIFQGFSIFCWRSIWLGALTYGWCVRKEYPYTDTVNGRTLVMHQFGLVLLAKKRPLFAGLKLGNTQFFLLKRLEMIQFDLRIFFNQVGWMKI